MELVEIRQFVGQHAPFSHLDPAQLSRVAKSITIQYFRRGSLIVDAGVPNTWLSQVRTGAVELSLGGTDLAARLGRASVSAIRR